MITVKLQGGCGNQMFQFAMGLAQAVRLNCDLQFDTSSFQHDRMREYSLCLFPRIQDIYGEQKFFVADIVKENGMPYNEKIVEGIKRNSHLTGWWQTEKYFQSIEYLIRWYFQSAPLTPAHRKYFELIMNSENPTFLTVRRTDYVGNAFHGELPVEYYQNALAFVEHKTKTKPDIFVFSDEPEWCYENLKLGSSFIVAGTYDRTVKGHLGREDADLFLMSLCKNAVMANSSFSWWGAYLGDSVRWSRGGIVVAPKQWFGPASNEDARDIVPIRWYQV